MPELITPPRRSSTRAAIRPSSAGSKGVAVRVTRTPPRVISSLGWESTMAPRFLGPADGGKNKSGRRSRAVACLPGCVARQLGSARRLKAAPPLRAGGSRHGHSVADRLGGRYPARPGRPGGDPASASRNGPSTSKPRRARGPGGGGRDAAGAPVGGGGRAGKGGDGDLGRGARADIEADRAVHTGDLVGRDAQVGEHLHVRPDRRDHPDRKS